MKFTKQFTRVAISTVLLSSIMANTVMADNIQDTYRSAFTGLMGSDATKEQKIDLIYPLNPANDLIEANIKSGEKAEDYFNRIRSLIPSPNIFKASSVNSETTLQSDKEDVEKFLRSMLTNSEEIPLFVFAPGIFGEFIKDHPFQDAIDNVNKKGGSAYNNEFQAKLKEFAKSKNINATDLRLELSTINYEKNYDGKSEHPLNELVLVGAIKDSSGTVLANTVTLDTAQLSLESLSALRANSTMFVRRISKFFNVMQKVPKNIILVGYSRGVPIALDMVALGSEKDCKDLVANSNEGLIYGCTSYSEKSWTKNIRGLLSVAGVIYGSELADVAFPDLNRSSKDMKDPSIARVLSETKPSFLLNELNTLNAKKVAALQKLTASLKFTENGIFSDSKNRNIKIKNSLAWAEFIFSMLKIQGINVEGQIEDFNKTVAADLVSGKLTIESMQNKLQAFETKLQNSFETDLKVDINASINQGISMLKSAFGGLNYNSNIKQFQVLIKETIDAASDLSTASRLVWWSTHTIPTEGIKYYSVSATMMGAADAPTVIDKETSKFSYNLSTVDYKNLYGSYSTFLSLGKNFDNNDSQVSLHKSTFLPQIAKALNPAQGEYQAKALALFHTHHWGLTLRSVTQVKAGAGEQTEPFPRLILLESSLAAMFADGQLEK
jgi:hypothetical protein